VLIHNAVSVSCYAAAAVQLFYAFVQENKIFLCLELANGGELFVQLQRQPAHRFPFNVAAFYIAEATRLPQTCPSVSLGGRILLGDILSYTLM